MGSQRLGKIIREKRELLGYSQYDLAFEINVTQQYISLIENGKKTPTIATLSAISDILELDFPELCKFITN